MIPLRGSAVGFGDSPTRFVSIFLHAEHLPCNEGTGDPALVGEGVLDVIEHVSLPLQFHVICLRH